jgi:hypothetical protein
MGPHGWGRSLLWSPSSASAVTPDLFRGPLGRAGGLEPLAVPLAAEWTPERVRGDGVVWAYGAGVATVVAIGVVAAAVAATGIATTGVVASGGRVAR